MDFYWTIITRDEKIIELPNDLKQFLLLNANEQYQIQACIRESIIQVVLVRSVYKKQDAGEHEGITKTKMVATDLAPHLLEFSLDGQFLKEKRVRLKNDGK